MNSYPSRKPGDEAVLRGRGFGHIWWAIPTRVVQDTPELVALYWCIGTPWKDVPRHPTGKEILTATEVFLHDKTWLRTDVLMLKTPSEAFSIWLMWGAGRQLDCWYINLETPLVRTPLGFEMMDHELDIVVSPDRSRWKWKDEAAFEEMTSVGVFSAEQARAIRRAGESALQLLLGNPSPLCDRWEGWTPPAGWTIPTLPSGWDL